MAHNQVLAGFQQGLNDRLDKEIQADIDHRKAQAKGLYELISTPGSGPEHEARVARAEQTLAKLFPQSKDLFGKITTLSRKLFGAMTPPPGVQDTIKAQTDDMFRQAQNQQAAADMDPNVAETYSGMMTPPPRMDPALAPSAQAQAQPAQAPATPVSPQAQAQATQATMQAQAPGNAPMTSTPPYMASSTMPQVSARPASPLAPPPRQSWAQDVNAAATASAAQARQQKIEDEQRIAGTSRETSRITDERNFGQSKELEGIKQGYGLETARENSKLKREETEASEKPFTATSNIVLNTKTGSFEVLPPQAAKPDTSLGLVEVAAIAADPADPRQKQMQEALKLLRQQNPPSETSQLLNEIRRVQLDEKTATSPGQVINAATKRPVNLSPNEAVLLKDMKFLTNQTKYVEELLKTAGDTGAIKGWVTVQGMTLPVVQDVLVNADQAELAAEIGRLNNAYVYAMSGKQINENEAVRLALTSPNIKYTPEINQRMLGGFGRATKAAVDGYMEVNGWAFAPGGKADTANTENPRAGGGAAGAGTLTPPPSAPATGVGTSGRTPTTGPNLAPKTRVRDKLTGKYYIIQADGSAVPEKP